jgi:hypothetical protein
LTQITVNGTPIADIQRFIPFEFAGRFLFIPEPDCEPEPPGPVQPTPDPANPTKPKHYVGSEGSFIRLPDRASGRVIEAGESVRLLEDDRIGIVIDRCEGSYVIHYLVSVDGGPTFQVKTDALIPLVNP